jgi:ABC-type antimicrobial peptide transport system permease subunit
MMVRKVLLRCPLIIILILIVASQAWTVEQSLSTTPIQQTGVNELAELDFNNILQHIQTFTSFGSRVTGYDGFFEAADYIKNYWESLGLTVGSESFNIVTPIIEKAIVTVQLPNGSKIEIQVYPLWPNQINPCPYQSPEEGDNLIYVPQGLPEDFDGLNPEGSFVLMDFNNRWYWKNAATFGAKGVIFLEPDITSCVEAVQKTFSVPLNFPRLYVKGENASLLRELVNQQGEVKIWVDSRMVWKEKTVSNLVAVIEGTNPTLKNEVVIIGAYYDSWSIVPQLSPGATDSMGIAFLLELSRLLTESRPERTIWLVAFAGHYQGLAGAREYIDSHFSELRSTIKMMFSLDLASDSDMTAVYATGAMYQYDRPAQFLRYYQPWLDDIFNIRTGWLPSFEQQLDQKSHFINGIQWSYPNFIVGFVPFEPFPKYFEAEVFTEACYGGGLGFVTTDSFRIYQYTPFDTYANVQQQNLQRQVVFLWPVLYNSASFFANFGQLSPGRADLSGVSDHGLVDVTIQLATYNRTSNYFNKHIDENGLFFVSVGPSSNPAGSVLVAGLTPSAGTGSASSAVVLGVIAGVFSVSPVQTSGGIVSSGALSPGIGFTVVLKPDEEGKVVIKGLRPRCGIDAQGYVLDPNTGDVLCATDTGPFGTLLIRQGTLFGAASSAAAPTATPGTGGIGYLMSTGRLARSFSDNSAHGFRYVPIINVSSIALVGYLNLWTMGSPQTLSIDILNFVSHSYLVWRDVLEFTPEAMVFAQPGTIAEILIRSSGTVVAVLNNASEKVPDGQGYMLVQRKTTVLTIFDAAENIYYLANQRGGFLESKMSANAKLVLYLDGMHHLKQLAEEARQNDENGKLYSYSIAYWLYAANAYVSSFGLIYDVVNTATFFFFLSAAFVVFLGKLVLGRETGIKRMLAIVVFFVITNVALSQVHPGYVIASNVWMLIDGLTVVLFSFLLLYIVLDEFNTAISAISRSVLGSHRSDIERGSLIISSLSMGVENLKKRPMRTALTLTTIIITVSAMTLFTTMGVMVQPRTSSVGSATYTGLLLKRPIPPASNVYNPTSELYMISIKDVASEGLTEFQLNPRAWIYPSGQNMFIIWNATTSSIRGMLAMTAQESKILEGARVPGQGDVFEPGMINSIIITDTLAERMGIDLGINVTYGTKLNIYGVPVTVRCIIFEDIGSALLSKDLDRNAILPPDPQATGLGGVYSPLGLSSLIIVPYDFAREYFNVQPNVIALSSNSTTLTLDDLGQRAFDMVLTLQQFDVSYGIKGETNAQQITTRDIYMLRGEENMIIPLFLSSLTLLSMMLSAVFERTREIRTLSTIGLSPRHIGAIFITESVALAFLGSFLGYFTGASVTSLLWNLNIFPKDLIPNVSSGVVIIVMGIMMAATVLSSVYPVSKASKMVTPSLLRKWRIGSKPVGDLWSIGLPFSAAPDESIGILGFLREFFEASATERTGIFMLLKPVQLTQEDERRIMSARLQLSPFDAGVIQDFSVISRPIAADRYGFEILIKRIEGLESIWTTTNKALLDIIRKQFLIWRALRPGDQKKYIEKAIVTWRSKLA